MKLQMDRKCRRRIALHMRPPSAGGRSKQLSQFGGLVIKELIA